MFEKVKSPFSIGLLRLENRAVMTAMGVNLGARGGGVTDDIIAYYEQRAAGGVGLIISEVTRVVDGAGGSGPCQLAARGFADIPDLQRLIDAVHKYPTKFFIQLQHPGRLVSALAAGEKPVVPSVLPSDPPDSVHELETKECEALVQAFAMGALCSQMAGADGVELHAAHGYLINEFISPAMNLRTDVYGGDFDGRMRFLLEIIEGIRVYCGSRFPVSVRINAMEDIPGGITYDEAGKIAAKLEEAGIDLINVSCLQTGCIEPGTYAQGWKREMAEAVKRRVGIPVLAVNNIKEPAVSESLLEEGVCDLVGVARGHLADPEWCDKAFSGKRELIRPCIGCLVCFSEIVRFRRIRCSVNPLTGREREYAFLKRDGAGRAVAIVGGGPAGITAALVLKERGYRPVIFEEGDRLGGALNIAKLGFGKDSIARYIDALSAHIEHAGIEVRYHERATAESVRAFDPAGVFVACGAAPFVPDIPGIEGKNICTAEEVLVGDVKPEGSIAVIGAGMTGLETAEVMASHGCDITLVEIHDTVGPGMYGPVVDDVMGRILPHHPRILTRHRLEAIEPDAIRLRQLDEHAETKVGRDWVVLAMGVKPRNIGVQKFKEVFDHVYVVGDAIRGGRIVDATQSAYASAFVARFTG